MSSPYVYNITGHVHHSQRMVGRYQRLPRPAKLALDLPNLPAAKVHYQLFDLDVKKVVEQGEVSGAKSFDLGNSDRDYFVLTTPSEDK